MKFIKDHFLNFAILSILAAGACFRAVGYGDLRLSTATAETDSYMNSAANPVFSWGIFAGQRLFTTNLIYKFASDQRQCPFISYGKPGIGEEAERKIQSCFDKIALLQNILSIFGWCFLGWALARRLKNPFVKIVSASAVMTFGFTPQIAEWDSVLSPESLSLSLFAIALALALELAPRAVETENPFQTKSEKLLLGAFVVVFLLWVFVRDVHLYAIPIALALLAPLFFVKKFRGSKPLAVAFGILLLFFIVGYASARDSLRATRYPLMNSLDAYIWPHPARVEFFRAHGMPDKEAPSYFDSPKYQSWADENAAKTYALFLVAHPGFVATTLWENMDLLTGDFAQPYFLTDEIKNRASLLVIGETVNPESGSAYLLPLLTTLTFLSQLPRRRVPALTAWAWLAVWMYGVAAGTLLISFFGDTAGIRRHIMPSVELMRLHLLIFLPPFLDLSLPSREA